MIGQTISHYRILEQLGGGGMGVVYKAEDTLLKRTVALKFLPPALTMDPEAKERFIHEARAASALDHPHICAIHEIGQTGDGQLFIVMACYDGQTLKKKIEQGPLDIDLALDVAIQAASGLSRAHEAGIVHRDIKPANIMLTTHNEVKILDFGLAKLGGGSVLTRTGTTLGTAAYMSPEQARGDQVDQRSDIWSLGAVLYELLTGQRAFLSDYEQALVYSILNEEPKPIRKLRPEVPEAVEQIVGKALAKNAEERYQTAEELVADLRIARGVDSPGGTIAAAEAAKKKQKKTFLRKLTAAGLALVVVAMGLFGGLPLLQDQALASHPRGIAFISLENNTGEGSLEYLRNVLPGVLSTTLGDSKYIRVTRSDRVRELMKQVGKDTVEFIDRATGLLLCKRAGIDVMAVGRYTKAGPVFLAELELIDVNTGERLGSPMKARGREVESFLKEDGIVDDLARQISHGMGVSKLGSQTSIKPVAEVSSSSLEAQRYYEIGKRELAKVNPQDARRFLELAVKDDSTFAIAWFWLGVSCQWTGDALGAKTAGEQAVKYASKATEKERLWIAASDTGYCANLLRSYGYSIAGGDWMSFQKARTEICPSEAGFRRAYGIILRNAGKFSEAIVQFEKELQIDPAYVEAYGELGYSYVYTGQYDKANKMFERYIELEPGEPNPLQSMGEGLMIQGRFSEAIAKCEDALQVKPDWWGAAMTLSRIYFMKEDYDQAVHWAARAAEKAPPPILRADCLWWEAWYLIWAGRLKEAEGALKATEKQIFNEYIMKRISDSSEKNFSWGTQWLRGWCAYEKGDLKNARLLFSNFADTETPWLPQFCLGLLDLKQGITDSLGMRLERIKDTVETHSLRVPARAEINDENGRCARKTLEGAYLFATHHFAEIRADWVHKRTGPVQNPDSLTTACWPIYVPWEGDVSYFTWIPTPFDIVPLAYIERDMIDSAIAVYELAIRKPPLAGGPIVPRYYYRLARLYEQKGMKDKAIDNYTTFLKVWGKADPVYKEPADARARIARLKGARS